MLDYSNENFLEEKQNKLSIAIKLRSWFDGLFFKLVFCFIKKIFNNKFL